MERRWSVPIISALVALLAVVLVAPGLDPAEGAIPNKNGLYRACLTKSTGAVRVINYPKVKCAKGQRLISWNAKGPAGPQGPQGSPGAQGAQGIQGAPGAAGITKITLTRVATEPAKAIPPNDFTNTSVDCPAGKVVGGGFNAATDVNVFFSNAVDADTWWVGGRNPSNENKVLQAYAICMTTEPGTVIATASKGYKVAKRKGR